MSEAHQRRGFGYYFEDFKSKVGLVKSLCEDFYHYPLIDVDKMTLDESIPLFQKKLEIWPDLESQRLYLSGLVGAFHLRYMEKKLDIDMDQWIQYAQRLLEISHWSDRRQDALTALADAFELRYQDKDAKADVDKAIGYTRQLLHSPEGPKSEVRPALARLLLNRYLKYHNMADLDDSVNHCQQQLQDVSPAGIIPHFCCHMLCRSFRERFLKLDQIQDLEQSILNGQQALDAVAAGSSAEVIYLRNMSESLRQRAMISLQLSDLKAYTQCNERLIKARGPELSQDISAILDQMQSLQSYLRSRAGDLPEHVVEWRKPEYAEQAANSAQASSDLRAIEKFDRAAQGYLVRYSKTEQLSDLHKAIECSKKTVDFSSEDHPRRAEFPLGLSHQLTVRGEALHCQSDSLIAITHAESAVAITPEAHPDRADRLNTLGSVQLQYHRQFGSLSDLEDSIRNLQYAVYSSSEKQSECGSHCTMVNCYHIFLLNLGTALSLRFGSTGQMSDFEHSMRCVDEIASYVSGSGVGDSTKIYCLSLLGAAYQLRFRVRLEIADLDQSIKIYRSMTDMAHVTPEQRRQSSFQLATSLWDRFRISHLTEDIEEAIKLCEVVDESGCAGRTRMICLEYLGKFYLTKSMRSGQISDMEHSIRHFEQALGLIPSGEAMFAPIRKMILVDLGHSFRYLWEQTKSNQHLEKSTDAFWEVSHFSLDGQVSPREVFDARFFLINNYVLKGAWPWAAG